jgi:hypothetical protein
MQMIFIKICWFISIVYLTYTVVSIPFNRYIPPTKCYLVTYVSGPTSKTIHGNFFSKGRFFGEIHQQTIRGNWEKYASSQSGTTNAVVTGFFEISCKNIKL